MIDFHRRLQCSAAAAAAGNSFYADHSTVNDDYSRIHDYSIKERSQLQQNLQ